MNIEDYLGIDMNHLVVRVCDCCGKEYRAPYSEIPPAVVICPECGKRGIDPNDYRRKQ